MRYRKISTCLKEAYGEKTYKIPVHLAGSCPNRDGTCGTGGCTICGEGGIDFDLLDSALSVSEQVQRNKEHIRKKYGARQFIIYFQNYTTTYQSTREVMRLVEEVAKEDVREIALSARPDYLRDDLLDSLAEFKARRGIEIVFEMGIQCFNDDLLASINRGHGVKEIIEAVRRIHSRGLLICSHLILNLPGATLEDVLTSVDYINQLGIKRVKCHSLYIAKRSALAKDYREGKVPMITADTYLRWVMDFLRRLSPDVCVERLFSRAPESESLFCNWGRSWRFLQNELERIMAEKNYRQGDLYEIN